MTYRLRSFYIDQSLVRTYLYAFHAKITFFMIHISKTIYSVKCTIGANIFTFTTFSTSNGYNKTVSFFHQNKLTSES